MAAMPAARTTLRHTQRGAWRLARRVLAALLLPVAAAPAWATQIATDNFNSYSAGTVTTTANGGTGWSSGWTLGSGTSVVSTTAGAGPTGDAPMAGQALQFASNSNTAALRLLSTPTSANLWIEFLFQVHTGNIDTSDFLAMYLDTAAGSANSTRSNVPNIGLNANCGGSPSACTADLFVRVASSSSSFTQAITVGQSYRLVGLLQKTDASSTYNRFSMWVDPTELELKNFATADAVATGSTGVGTVGRVGFRTSGMDGGASADRYYVDAISLMAQLPVTTSANAGGQVPLPRSVALVGAALLALAFTRRRADAGKSRQEKRRLKQPPWVACGACRSARVSQALRRRAAMPPAISSAMPASAREPGSGTLTVIWELPMAAPAALRSCRSNTVLLGLPGLKA